MNRRADIQAQNRRGAMIMVGCVGALAAVGGVVWAGRPAARDQITGCRLDNLSRQHVVAIADTSDGYSPAQLTLVQAALTKLSTDIVIDDRLSLYVYGGLARSAAPTPVFERCFVGDGSQASSLTTTVSQVKKAHEVQWRAPLAKALDGLRSAPHPRSELVQLLSDVAGLVPYRPKGETTRIVLISNLEEHGEVSFHARKPLLTASEFVAYFKHTIKDRLNGLTLDIVYVPAPKTTPDLTRRTKAAWTQALTASGVRFTLKDL